MPDDLIHGDPGKFGRMFPTLPPLQASDDKLFELAQAMRDPDPASAAGDNPDATRRAGGGPVGDDELPLAFARP